ncbi:hypothetical protein [Neisseria musculi]|uniref:hypothetical protein n=1 Tax=Neisseria musculi TaxID=1815583 RepID=UPI00164A8A22|nr:hypothetical protein [Neisseria musculi]
MHILSCMLITVFWLRVDAKLIPTLLFHHWWLGLIMLGMFVYSCLLIRLHFLFAVLPVLMALKTLSALFV